MAPASMTHDLNLAALAVVSACVVVWGLVSARLERWDVSAPIAFVVLGLVVTHGPTSSSTSTCTRRPSARWRRSTLALVLFADASRVNARAAAGRPGAARPASSASGCRSPSAPAPRSPRCLFGGSGLWVAAAIGAIVAPTDAALGASIMEDERVPAGVRRLLNVESGLNDGIATPFVNLFLAGAATAEAVQRRPPSPRAVLELLGGAGLGVGVGVVGAVLLVLARTPRLERSRVPAPGHSRPGAVRLLARRCVAGTNGFIAAFVAGMAFGTVFHRHDDEAARVHRGGGHAPLAAGLVRLRRRHAGPGPRGRRLARRRLRPPGTHRWCAWCPVALALAGSGLDRATVAFVGWFGPRGLASVVFGLIAVDSLAPADAKVVLAAVTVTVALSVLLHGVTASPLAARYGAVAARLHPERPEHVSAGPIGTRSLRRPRPPLSRGSAT